MFILPQQVSLSLEAGTEVLIRDLHDVLQAHGLGPYKILLGVDAKNAFKCIIRAVVLRLVILPVNPAAQLVRALHGGQPFLSGRGQPEEEAAERVTLLSTFGRAQKLSFAGTENLRPAERTQKGHALGGPILCLVIQPLVERINGACRLDFNGWYTDDGNHLRRRRLCR